jgi:hypothetical protein
MPFVPFFETMQSVLEFDRLGLRPSRGAAAITGVTRHEGFAAAVLALLSGVALSGSGWFILGRIPLAVTALAMLMTPFTVISALKKML